MKYNKKKIAVIGLKGLPAFGGAATVGENQINKLKNDFDFTVYSLSTYTDLKTGYYNGYNQIVFKSSGKKGIHTFIYYIKCLFHCLFIKNFELIHLHHAESGFIVPFLRLKYKVIVTFHGIFDKIDPKFSKSINKFFKFSQTLNVKFANEIISVSLPDKYFLNTKYNQNISYISNGIDFSNEIKKIIDAKKTEDYIVFAAGRIYEIKGLHLLIDAIKISKIKTKLLIIGDINHDLSYKNKIINMSKDLNVEFIDLIKDKTELLKIISNAKYFIFPSITEAMSMMLLEVISVKTPVIASDIPSNKAIFNENELTFFESNNSLSLSKCITFAQNNHQKLNLKSDNAFDRLVKEYTWDKIAINYKQIYLKNLKK